MDTYLPATPARILEIGAQNVNGSLRDHAPRNAEYVGLDFEAGEGVDIVVTGLLDWNVPDASFDMVMASSVFEHDKAFWRTFLAMCAKTKPGGHIYISAPSNGTVHRYPQDYWRFYPDSGLALEEWARDEGFEVSLVESFIAEREAEVWNDFCAVFRRGPSDAELGRDFVFSKVPSTNAVTWRSSVITNLVDDSEDTRLLRAAREEAQRWVVHADYLNALHAEEMDLRSREISDLTHKIEQQAQRLAGMDANEEELAAFRKRAEELEGELERLNAEVQEQARQHKHQLRQLEASSGELQSRLAQRDEEAAQAWAVADERGQECDRLAVEAQKARADLVDANGWVERLALTRTQMERRVARLEKALTTLSMNFERVQQRNGALVERIGVLSAQAASPGQARTSETSEHTISAHAQPRHEAQPADTPEHTHRAVMADLEKSHVHLKSVTDDLSETRSRLEECRDEIATLSDMMAGAQDQIADLERQNEWLRQSGSFLLERGKWWWRFMPRAWQRRQRDARLLRRGLFDATGYANRYPDVSSAGQDPFRHFIHHGIAENRHYD